MISIFEFIQKTGTMAVIAGMLEYVLPNGNMKKSGRMAIAFAVLAFTAESVLALIGG